MVKMHTRQSVLVLQFDLGKIKSQHHFFSQMNMVFNLPSFFCGSFDSLNDCMRDLSWFDENYLLIHFVGLERLKNTQSKPLYLDILHSIECWQAFWHHLDNAFIDDKAAQKTVVISIN